MLAGAVRDRSRSPLPLTFGGRDEWGGAEFWADAGNNLSPQFLTDRSLGRQLIDITGSGGWFERRGSWFPVMFRSKA